MSENKKLRNWNENFEYFRAYDFFQLECSNRYPQMLNWHLSELQNYENILETGAGTGNLTYLLLKSNCKVTAIDINREALGILEKKCGEFKNHLKIILGDVQKLESIIEPNFFDASSSMIVHPFPENNFDYLNGIYQSLKKGGKHVITSWSFVENIEEGVIDILESEILAKGFSNKYPKEWEQIKKSGSEFSKIILEREFSFNKLIMYLKKIGFKNINSFKSPYGKYAYSITCQK